MSGCTCVPFRFVPVAYDRCEFWVVGEMDDGDVRGFCGCVDEDPTFDPRFDCIYKMCHLHRPDLFVSATLEEMARCLCDQPGASVSFFERDHCDPFD